jgi:pimeloyl-ACP methyl ester carboxylesterase
MQVTTYHPFLSEKAKARYLEFNDERAKNWPVPCECRTVETSRGRTFMRISGPPGAPPLVLLPGGGTHSLMWIPNIAGLSGPYRTYALDSIHDVGRSANLLPVKSVEDLTAWLDELFDALALGPGLRLMGLSHGAWLAANYAQRHPARVAKLVLLAPAGWVLQLSPAMLFTMMQVLLLPRRYFIRRTYAWSLPDLVASGAPGQRIIAEMTEDFARAFECLGMRRMVRILEPKVATDEEIQALRMPTLFVIGERERIYSSRDALARLERVHPAMERAVIPGAGHDMTWLKPDVVNAAVLEFLARP